MRLIITIATTLLLLGILNAQPVKILLVTGGHSYDTLHFFNLFDSLEGIEYEHILQPEANRKLLAGAVDEFEVLLFYDMWKEISEPEKEAYLELTKSGKPFLFMHHALVSYQKWPEFEKLLGGRYVDRSPDVPVEMQSTYRHDVWVNVQVVDTEHPVTKGFQDFRLFDEVYGNYRVSSGVIPLLKTDHPESTPVIAWENRYNNSTIIYLQSGHDNNAYASEEFRQLIINAIKYLAKRN